VVISETIVMNIEHEMKVLLKSIYEYEHIKDVCIFTDMLTLVYMYTYV
jgi:hypothetical protein